MDRATVTVSIADVHAPFQDDRAVELACIVIQALQPDRVVHHADGVDFYQLSSFDKDPDRTTRLQDDLDTAYRVNETLNSAAPEAEWLYLNDGNHERRLWRYLARNPELFQLEVLRLDNLLRLDKLGWRLVEPVEMLEKRLLFVHGERASKHAGWSVKAELERRWYQQSILMGHSHKIGCYTARGPRQAVGGWEVGCLCTLEPEYMRNPNWMQGLAVVTSSNAPDSNHTFSVEQVVFTGTERSRRCFFRGKEFVAR